MKKFILKTLLLIKKLMLWGGGQISALTRLSEQ